MKKFRWGKQREPDLDAEIRSHLDEAIRERIERGEAPDEARANALREFGNVGLVKEVTREMWGWGRLEQFGQDLRFGLRMLRKNPGVSLVAILTLALGVGANTVIFSVVSAVLLRPLPYRDAERIVAVSELVDDGSLTPVSPANWEDLRAQQSVFETIAALEFDSFNLAGAQQPEHISGALATGEFFRVLRVDAVLGRTLSPEDERPESAHVALLSHGLWRRMFGGDPSVIGRQVKLYGADNPGEGGSYIVVGVLPPDFWFASEQFDVWVPRRFTAEQLANRGSRSQQVIARLKPEATTAQAQAQLQAIGRRLAVTHPQENRRRSFSVTSLQQRLLGEFGAAMVMLLCAVSFVLLIACANVANLLLARAAARRKEITIRSAMGASRFRIVAEAAWGQQFLGRLMALFGVLALGLALIGIYSVIAYTVTQRTYEIGVRIALGAQADDVRRLILKQGVKLTLIGAAIGLVVAFGLTRFLAGLLFGVSAGDPLIFASVTGALIAAALLACWIPARRATTVDPLIAIRCE